MKKRLPQGQDGFLGTSDDKYVISETNNWPENITDFLADEIRIRTQAGRTEDIQVKIGIQTKFIAEIYFRGKLMGDHEVTWSINGHGDTNTTISEDGVLSIGANERENTKINVIATSKKQPNKLRSNIIVNTILLGYEDIPAVEVGSETTVKIGDISYYVLVNDGRKALLFAKDSIGSQAFNSTNTIEDHWGASSLRTYLNTTWLNSQGSIIKDNIIETQIYSAYRDYYDNNKSDVIETIDKVFLLGPEDFDDPSYNGSNNDPRLYTAGVPAIAKVSLHAQGTTWLRSTKRWRNGGSMHAFSVGGGRVIPETTIIYDSAIRPAFWINLAGSTSK